MFESLESRILLSAEIEQRIPETETITIEEQIRLDLIDDALRKIVDEIQAPPGPPLVPDTSWFEKMLQYITPPGPAIPPGAFSS